jgi:CDP-glucose 4,6-dehydratase
VVTPSPSIWRGLRVLVTGNTGFKGTWLSLWLHRLGAKLTGYSLPPDTTPSLFAATGCDRLYPTTAGDVRDAGALAAAIEGTRPEVVFHLAAEAIVQRAHEDPLRAFSTNVMGTAHLLEAVRREPSVRAAIVVTSDKCYMPRAGARHAESDPLGGRGPYAASKACAELVAMSYDASYFSAAGSGAAIATARAGNVIGGGDWAPGRLIPDLVRRLHEGRALVLRHPAAVRPWQHVLDPSCGYMLLAEGLLRKPEVFRGSWNFGPAEPAPVTVLEMARAFASASGVSLPPEIVAEEGAGLEEQWLALDSSKARSQLGWQTQWSVQESVARSASWYRAFYGGKGADVLTAAEIEEYCGNA